MLFRSQYDSHVTVRSPQGRLHQVDYAVEVMKQGSATVGIKSKTLKESGCHIVKTDPSAEVVGMLAVSIGGRSQSARTYLEAHLNEFPEATLDQLIKHALKDDKAKVVLTEENTSIGIVGKDQPFKLLEKEEILLYLQGI